MDVCESCLEFSKRPLSFGLSTMTRCQGFFQPREVTSKLKLRQYLPAQGPERLQLLRTQLPRYSVKYAQGSQCLAVRRQGRTCVEPDFRFRHNQRILCKPLVLSGIRHDKNIWLENRRGAKSNVAGGFGDGDTDLRFEPLPVSVYQANECDGRLAYVGS